MHNSRRLLSSSITYLPRYTPYCLSPWKSLAHHPLPATHPAITQTHAHAHAHTKSACRPNQGRLTCDAFRQAPALRATTVPAKLASSRHLISSLRRRRRLRLFSPPPPAHFRASFLTFASANQPVLFAPPPHRPPAANGPGGSSGVRLIHGQREQFQFQLHYTRTQGANIDDFSGSGWHVRLALERVGSHGYVDQHHAGLPQGLQNTGLRPLSASQDQMRPQHALLQLPQGASYRFELSSASFSALSPATSAFSVYASQLCSHASGSRFILHVPY